MSERGRVQPYRRLRKEIRQLREHLELKDRQLCELAEANAELRQKVQSLSDEIKVLKNLPKRPQLKPSGMHDKTRAKVSKKSGKAKKKPVRGPKKFSDKAQRVEVVVKAQNVPEGSRLIGYRDYRVQDLVLCPMLIRYRRERWQTPSGRRITAPLPEHVKGHFGADLHRLVVALYYQGQSTVPRIVALLKDWDVTISKRSVMRMLTVGMRELVEEADAVLAAGIDGAKWLHVDDTGARHQCQNGYCTVIGNDQFTYFASRNTKTRLNFLQLLTGKERQYVINEAALDYMRERKLPRKTINLLKHHLARRFECEHLFSSFLQELGIGQRQVNPSPLPIILEGALWGALAEAGTLISTVILSDDAGQFKLGLHALCWVHAERHLQKLCGLSDAHRRAVDDKQRQIWDYYRQLFEYRLHPDPELREPLRHKFDQIFQDKTCYPSLNRLLQRLYKNKSELLRALDYPHTPLHNNLCENDGRAQVMRRKISAGTRSDAGRDARDAGLALLKTCQKQNISFWHYLGNRFKVPDAPDIPHLTTLVSQLETSAAPT